MNKQRRAKLKRAKALLNEVSDIIDDVTDEEQECLDNYPESLIGSDNYNNSEEALDTLQELADIISDAINTIDEI